MYFQNIITRCSSLRLVDTFCSDRRETQWIGANHDTFSTLQPTFILPQSLCILLGEAWWNFWLFGVVGLKGPLCIRYSFGGPFWVLIF